jgi:putative transposase
VASLRAGCPRVPMRLVGFCVMPTLFHLLLWPYDDGDLSVWMPWRLTDHAHGYRRRYRGSGHVWQGRFRSFPIEEAEHLPIVLRYVERNPLRAGLVCRAEDWPWSSLPIWPYPPLMPWLDPGPVPRPANWLEHVQTPNTEGEVCSASAMRRPRLSLSLHSLGRVHRQATRPGIEPE